LAAEERRAWLLTQLRASKSVSLTDAAAALGVSEMTVRRDLNGMESLGIARRVRGGAIYSGPVSFQGRERSHVEEKRVIAAKLLPLVPERGVVAMDSSTTMHRLAQIMTECVDLTVVTNGLLTFQVLQDRPGITAILTGGAADRRSDSLIGPVATGVLESMRFATFFASAAAIDERACYEDTLEEAEVKRAFARSSSRIVVGVHAEKLEGNATAASLPLERVSVLATDLEPSDSGLVRYRQLTGDVL
jgi:Transcriptional regulators of sugar metabolism